MTGIWCDVVGALRNITLSITVSDKTTPNLLIFTSWVFLHIFGKTESGIYTLFKFLQR